jgi:hypothetical protein
VLDHRRIAGLNKKVGQSGTARHDLDYAPTGHQVNDHKHQGDNQQHVDQAASNAETKSQEPQNQKYRYKCPKHNIPSFDCDQLLI